MPALCVSLSRDHLPPTLEHRSNPMTSPKPPSAFSSLTMAKPAGPNPITPTVFFFALIVVVSMDIDSQEERSETYTQNKWRQFSNMEQQQAIVLFYMYFSSSSSSSSSPGHATAIRRWWEDPKGNIRRLYQWHETNLSTISSSTENQLAANKRRLALVGRILIAPEGINGTVSGNRAFVEAYVERLREYDSVFGATETGGSNTDGADLRIFRDVDYKMSYDSSPEPLFPDLKISIVKEIVSTSGLVDVHDVPLETGKHLTPEEFHQVLEDSKNQEQSKEIALIDVRNTFEHDIGYFVDPRTKSKAIDPETTTFSSFDKFCERNAEELRNKKVMMYCTGGIRCEKASVLLKRRGVEDVNQLSGGIHRYLEKYGNTGHFKGLNFTFDKRVAMKPNFATEFCNDTGKDLESDDHKAPSCDDTKDDSYDIVGRCVECDDPFDELCGSRVCTVCRDLVLVCEKCRSRSSLREYHCKRHSEWKNCYFSFLEIFDLNELEAQLNALRALRDEDSMAKSVRRTLTRQINKVESRIRAVNDGSQSVDKNAPRRCRSCQEVLGQACDGKCWGFWRKVEVLPTLTTNENKTQGVGICDDSKNTSNDSTKRAKIAAKRGRRAKQKLEAEMEFLPRPPAGSTLASE
ncbi:unnamed protein product [Pseudo-nitzschia multistriata]|uniref:Rhodanese domain-containing protein n=1 Tax=Pseudo-nitzschia multistriata TaxID=183589 RepID=A0A448Z609_9STRA|nr:unnamed protein product [Pseudo-nitzschia multistriata]